MIERRVIAPGRPAPAKVEVGKENFKPRETPIVVHLPQAADTVRRFRG